MQAISRKRIGSVPGCLFLEAHDVGEAVLDDGRTVTITWGGNFRGRQDFTGPFQPQLVLLNDTSEPCYEMLIPEPTATKLRSILNLH